jgi:hypothetical protein
VTGSDHRPPGNREGATSDLGWRAILHEQMEEILGEVSRQEAWAQIEARIDAVLANVRPTVG